MSQWYKTPLLSLSASIGVQLNKLNTQNAGIGFTEQKNYVCFSIF